MLKPGGVLAICIDHRELFRLGQMLDELFDEENRIAVINWEKSYSPRSDNGHVSTATEYVLVYAKDADKAKTGLLPRTDVMDARYSSPDGDLRLWKSGDLSAGKGKTNQNMVYAIQSPFTGKLEYPPAGNCWRLAQRELKAALEGWGVSYKVTRLKDDAKRAELLSIPVKDLKPASALMVDGSLPQAREAAERVLADGPWPRVYFGRDGQGRPTSKRYLEDVKQGKVPMTWWADDDYDEPLELGSTSWSHEESGHSQTGVAELDAILGDTHGFTTVKPLKLITKIIQIWCPPNGVVLDPFAGSGTTGHAVLQLNDLGVGNRRFVLIETGRPENGDNYAQTLTAERLRRAIDGTWANGKGSPLGGGFRFTALDKRVDAAALLKLERDEMVDTVIASYFDSNQRRGHGLVTYDADANHRYLVARNGDNEGFFLVWDGAAANTDFDEDVYEACADEAAAAGLRPIYHVYARFNYYQTENVRFYQIPDRILADFGLDLKSEPFSEADLG
jgi:adenine-specific DNA-methyltransferase